MLMLAWTLNTIPGYDANVYAGVNTEQYTIYDAIVYAGVNSIPSYDANVYAGVNSIPGYDAIV